MTRRPDYLHPLTREEIERTERAIEEAERLHSLDLGGVALTIVVISIVAFFIETGFNSEYIVGMALIAIFSVIFYIVARAEVSIASESNWPTCPRGSCRQGRDCTCARMEQRSGGALVNTDQLLAMGSMTGPHRRTRPITLSLWQRLVRWMRGAL